MLCDQHPHPALSFPSPRKIPRTHQAITPRSPLLPFPSIDLLSMSMDLPLLDTSRGRNHTTCGLERLASLTEHRVLKPVHIVALRSFSRPDAAPLRVCILRLSIRSSVDEHLGRVHRLTMMSDAAVSARGQVSANIRFHFSWAKFLRSTFEEGSFPPS